MNIETMSPSAILEQWDREYIEEQEYIGILDLIRNPKKVKNELKNSFNDSMFGKEIQSRKDAKISKLNKQKQQEEENRFKEQRNADLEEMQNLSAEDRREFLKFAHSKEDEFEKVAKSELRKMMNDKKFKESIIDDINKAFESGILDSEDNDHKKFYKTGKLPKTYIKNYGDYWEVIDGDQEIKIACCRICDELASRLEKITGYYISTGDGDEGCIYPAELLDGLLLYREFKASKNK